MTAGSLRLAGEGSISEAAGRTVYQLLNDTLDELAAGLPHRALLTRERHVLPYFHGNRSLGGGAVAGYHEVKHRVFQRLYDDQMAYCALMERCLDAPPHTAQE